MLARTLYTLLLILAAPLLLFGLYRKRPNKPTFGSRWKEHFGWCPAYTGPTKPIWIHAVSVGECIAATPLIKAIKEKQPQQAIIVTTTTSTGAAQIAKLGEMVEHRYMPIDFSCAVQSFINKINPKQLLIIETELWPNTLNQVHKNNIPIIVVNARLSEKSFHNYAMIKHLFSHMHCKISKILCQTQADAERFAQLGVDKDKLIITGSIKFDIKISKEIQQQGKILRESIGPTRPVWIATSTHAGEDEIMLDSHKIILAHRKNALLIIVPRHPERFDQVAQLCAKEDFIVERRTKAVNIEPDTQIYLADTMGEMLTLLSTADACFMGGSLLGHKVGGHNLLEPTAAGIASVTGPSYFNFQDITESLLKHNLVTIASAPNKIATSIEQLWQQNPTKTKQRCESFMSLYGGAIEKTLKLLE
ncbi:lipid IV(A) 3-deoxy-D-manno-octulosonic acid transferase [Vibrio renipiscarius]|uniref:3-deoxy-D-manno-octulosonic acid transferase n=1 Tax=Vibrio renipiscarius TaxID=1461322 RepID=A0A0C2NQ62_9VIBR|nr:lipid IV(A) 3-deoxy-D-manno-octulosonic acid transferase [Vibrio renipiscarius]KII81199.1 3-deoxy-D-manno-octulosonic acid transferase [Vibrio renipiscarius]KII81616.1 3-deoxy-D-manno-octulosonic acid transferase [Vibrio renipiscarius]